MNGLYDTFEFLFALILLPFVLLGFLAIWIWDRIK